MEPGSPMRDESHSVLKRVIRGHRPEVGCNWHTLNQAMTEVTSNHSPEGESLLREVIHFSGEISLSDVSPVPHAMSPTDALKSQAIQALGRWNKIRRQDLSKLEDSGPSAMLLAVAKAQPVSDGPSEP